VKKDFDIYAKTKTYHQKHIDISENKLYNYSMSIM